MTESVSIRPRTSFLFLISLTFWLMIGCGASNEQSANNIQKGDPAHKGGTATVREPYTPKTDDPATTNDESNDQPLGHFGTVTLYAYNSSSGNTYTLDADVEDGEVKRLYFAKGGWVDFDSSEIDSDCNGSGTDERGRQWEFRGLATGSIDAADEDDESTEDEESDSEDDESDGDQSDEQDSL